MTRILAALWLALILAGCQEAVGGAGWPDDTDALEETDTGDRAPMGTASDSATLPDDPETDFGNTDTPPETALPTDATAEPEPTAAPTDPDPSATAAPTDAPPDTGSATDLPGTVPVEPTAPDTGSGPITDVPWPTDPTDPEPTGPTDEPGPTGEPDPTEEPEPTALDTGSDEPPCYYATGYNGSRKWRQPALGSMDAGVARYGENTTDGRDICQEMNARADCGITTWRMARLDDFTAVDITINDDPAAPCRCSWTFDASPCFDVAWAGPMDMGTTRWRVLCGHGAAPYYLITQKGNPLDALPVWCLSDGYPE